MAFKEQLKSARLAKGYTQEQLATAIGVAKSTFTGYEKGNSEPNMLTIKKLMEILEVDANYLWYDENDNSNSFVTSFIEQQIIKKYRLIDETGKNTVEFVLNDIYDRCVKEPAPLYETVLKPAYQCGLSAGTGLYAFDDVPTEQIEVPIDFKDIDFVISVSGDSMEPTYRGGDKVMIKKQRDIKIGEIGAFMVNGEAYIKELGNKCLISHNKKYAPIHFNESMRIDCIGKVIGKL
ncbi:XRE family transcriptional regulator [Thomasclavelia ramosa]|uniref:XRE family transcriptional regulator n=1 Tax=Thomasclavelia ramosa TaxID=1547 RepID=UPI0032C08B3C